MSKNSIIQFMIPIDDKTVNHIQNCQYMVVLSIIFPSLAFFYFTGYKMLLNMCMFIISLQCLTDMLFCKNEFYLHHISVLLLTTFMYMKQLENVEGQVLTLISTEFSTIFFTTRSILNDNPLPFHMNKITLEKIRSAVDNLFVCTFFYTRIYSYSRYLIFNKQFNQYMMMNYTNTPISFFHFYGANYVLYFLNVYWFCIILKKLFKRVKDYPLFHPKNVQYLIRYTYFIQNFIVLSCYTPFKNSIYFLDVFGNTCLSCSSYYFHNSIYEKLLKNEEEKRDRDRNRDRDKEQEDNDNQTISSIDVDRLDNDIIQHYINDIIFIQLRMFLSVFVNLNPVQILYKNSIVFTNEKSFFLYKVGLFFVFFSFVNCSLGLYRYCEFILTMKMKNIVFPYFHDKINVVTTSVIIGMTMASTLIVVLYNTGDTQLRNDMFVVSVILTLMMYTQPFYQVSYLVTHIFLIYQTKLFCDANIFTNNGYFNEYALVEM